MDRSLKVGIVGLGLIGGSIFKALCALKCDVRAVSRATQTIEKAKEYSPNISKSLKDLKDCDLIFVCTPMNGVLEVLDKLESIVSAKTIVADVSSLKGFVCNKKRPYKFIPTHPMAGTEFKGFDNSFENLFMDSKWVLTPLKDTAKADIKKVTDIIKAFGSTPIFANPAEHDSAVALISHMPMIVSQAIFKTAQNNPLALKLASSGFRDMTRLALSNEEMAIDMVNLNSQNIQEAVLSLYSSIGELINQDYPKQIRKIKQQRQNMYIDSKNIL